MALDSPSELPFSLVAKTLIQESESMRDPTTLTLPLPPSLTRLFNSIMVMVRLITMSVIWTIPSFSALPSLLKTLL